MVDAVSETFLDNKRPEDETGGVWPAVGPTRH